ncbi:hypothetical protein EAH89_07200 [Roseomonas nepalensis]|uniref:Uncharacterized protein n=1 Tax=Muricoccus nepalensis TaxID=1854500 RepID=A0A502GDL2_9PROT|nr:hypothetical protein [Roseomonas nepalensis]TPG59126.1 hypothetical protein EAH89_07200 [Roseomonas nepalensis]
MQVLRLSRFLGWFSIALGLAELLGGRSLARQLGMQRHTNLIRAFGVREVANGAAILANPGSTPLLLARVAGDALDLAVLAGTRVYGPRERTNARWAIAAVAGVTLLDLLCAARLGTEDDDELPALPVYWD